MIFVRGARGRSPQEAPEFLKIFKKILKKIAKMHYFGIVFKKVNKACLTFSRV